MKVTVNICTWNRSTSLGRTLESLADMEAPSGIDWEVLVVNNNSTDDTDHVVDSFSGRLPTRHILETAQGLSHARNAGIKAARGEYIIWTDDDVIVGRRWLAAYCAAFEQWPGAAIFGGPVQPRFEEPTPSWLARGWKRVGAAFAWIDLGPLPIRLSVDQLPYGANFALRRADALNHLFDPLLGASPRGRYYSEEISLMQKLIDTGAEGWWVPDASVEHLIPRERMTVEYIRSYYERSGRTDYYLQWRNRNDGKAQVLGGPLWIWRGVVESDVKYWLSRMFLSQERWIFALRRRSVWRGALDESRRSAGRGDV